MTHTNEVTNSTSKGRKKRFSLKMPGAFTILFILTVIAVMATWMIPAGAYSKLSYDGGAVLMNLKLSMLIINQKQSLEHKNN